MPATRRQQRLNTRSPDSLRSQASLVLRMECFGSCADSSNHGQNSPRSCSHRRIVAFDTATLDRSFIPASPHRRAQCSQATPCFRDGADPSSFQTCSLRLARGMIPTTIQKMRLWPLMCSHAELALHLCSGRHFEISFFNLFGPEPSKLLEVCQCWTQLLSFIVDLGTARADTCTFGDPGSCSPVFWA